MWLLQLTTNPENLVLPMEASSAGRQHAWACPGCPSRAGEGHTLPGPSKSKHTRSHTHICLLVSMPLSPLSQYCHRGMLPESSAQGLGSGCTHPGH